MNAPSEPLEPVESFDQELEALIARQHATGLHPTLVLSRLAWQLCEVAIGSGVSWRQFAFRIAETWRAVEVDWSKRKALGAILVIQHQKRGQA